MYPEFHAHLLCAQDHQATIAFIPLKTVLHPLIQHRLLVFWTCYTVTTLGPPYPTVLFEHPISCMLSYPFSCFSLSFQWWHICQELPDTKCKGDQFLETSNVWKMFLSIFSSWLVVKVENTSWEIILFILHWPWLSWLLLRDPIQFWFPYFLVICGFSSDTVSSSLFISGSLKFPLDLPDCGSFHFFVCGTQWSLYIEKLTPSVLTTP